MKRVVALTLFVSVLTSCLVARANITSVVWTGSGGALSDVVYQNTGPQGDLSGGWLYASQGGSGQSSLSITTDTPLDPSFTIVTDTLNTSGFTWTSYLVDVSMSTSFTLSGVGNNIPGDWSSIVQNPGAPVAGVYTGHITFNAGTPVAPGSQFNFIYTLTFNGGSGLNVDTTLTPVPEPTALSLLAGGGLLLLVLRRRQ